MLVFPPGRSACDGDSLPGVRVGLRWASFRPVRHGTGHACGEPRCAGHSVGTRRGWLQQRRFRRASLRPVRRHRPTSPFCLGLPGWMVCMAMPCSRRSSSKTLRNPEPLSVWPPPDDDREGLEDALEGRLHVPRRRGGDGFCGDQFRGWRGGPEPRTDNSLPSCLQPFPASFPRLSGVPYVFDCLQCSASMHYLSPIRVGRLIRKSGRGRNALPRSG